MRCTASGKPLPPGSRSGANYNGGYTGCLWERYAGLSATGRGKGQGACPGLAPWTPRFGGIREGFGLAARRRCNHIRAYSVISYRRQDTKQIAGRIFDRLEAKFGAGSTFMDIDRIPFGVDFHTYLDEAVAVARIVLVLIGPGWAEAKDEAGRRRLDNPDDFVRIEVEAALRRNIPMGAVLIDGTPMPRAVQLPESMRPLLRRNASPVDAGRDFHVHMDRLIADLEKHLNGQPASAPAASAPPAAKPAWASNTDSDKYGRWAEFALGGVTQRMRWCGPGAFTMGSPADEPGRFDDEGPQHEVRLTQGFWLCDTPVTQALWRAAMGGNPSYFKHPKRPVEQVNWDDAQRFLQKMNVGVPGLDLVLPTEAQWEYACRAGKKTATYAGPIQILGERSAPVLDEIAWYGGNSGVGFELDSGYDSSGWAEKQYSHSRAGTRPVGQKLPNDWGLYDLLGNVWEWCADDRREYTANAVTDPAGPLDSALRVLRGGSWFENARLVRAASRNGHGRASRHRSIGLRCLSVRP